ncbi:MAG: PDZ domain-containing protein [Chitinophagaceae bacterium]|nr:MAG: PDZ domain-containing protein [Chitinophagaceae bacterium]
MNKVFIALMPWIFAAIGYKATAQETNKKGEKKETQVITIKKSGDENKDLKIEFKNDAVLINGKPLVEFKDDAITINNKKIVVKTGDKFSIYGDDGTAFEMDLKELEGMGERMVRSFDFGGSKTFLGVTTGNDEAGAKIMELTKDGAAAKAGLEKGDIITKVGDDKVGDPSDLSKIIAAKKPKDEVKITYKRNGKEKTTKATLQERKESESKSFSYFTGPQGRMKTITVPGQPGAPRAPGAIYRGEGMNIDSDVFVRGFGMGRPRLGLKIQDLEEGSGVKVLEVEAESAAEKAGLKKDDIIVAVADAKVNNTDEAREQLHENAEKSSYSIEAKRNGTTMKFDIKIPKKLKTADL